MLADYLTFSVANTTFIGGGKSRESSLFAVNYLYNLRN